MTTDRTAIRRWLEVGGRTHRPPIRALQGRHRSIVAPLAATLAAGRRGDAVARFMTYVGMPAEQVAGLRQSPFFPALEAIAPTLAYDHAGLLG